MPGKRISPIVESDIIRLYFNGVPRDEIARVLKISGGTVSNTISKFKETAKYETLDGASKIFGVDRDIADLRALGAHLRKIGINVSQASSGADILDKLQSMGVKEDEVEVFISDLYKDSQRRGYPVEKVVQSAVELSRLESKTGKRYDELIEDYGEKEKSKSNLEAEVKSLEAQIDQSKQRVTEALTKEKADLEALKEFVETKSSLQGYKISLEDLDRLKRFLRNAESSGFNIAKIQKWIGDIENLQSLLGELQKEVKDLESEKNRIEGALDKVKRDLTAEENTLSELNEYKRLGLDLEKLTRLRDLVVKIGAKNKLSPSDALKKLFLDLKMHYDLKLGYERDVEQLKKSVDDWAEKEKKLSGRYASYRTAVNALEELTKRGVTPPQIEEWNRIVTELKEDPSELASNIRKYRDLKKLLKDREREAQQADKEINGLKSQIKELETKKAGIEGSIRTLTSEGMRRIKSVTSQFDKSFADKLSLVDTAMKEKTERIKSTISEFENAIEALSEKSLKVGEELGRYEALEPLLKLISEREGAPHKVHSSVLQVNEAYSAWLKENKPRSLLLSGNLDGLIRDMREELGLPKH